MVSFTFLLFTNNTRECARRDFDGRATEQRPKLLLGRVQTSRALRSRVRVWHVIIYVRERTVYYLIRTIIKIIIIIVRVFKSGNNRPRRPRRRGIIELQSQTTSFSLPLHTVTLSLSISFRRFTTRKPVVLKHG